MKQTINNTNCSNEFDYDELDKQIDLSKISNDFVPYYKRPEYLNKFYNKSHTSNNKNKKNKKRKNVH
ncbi:MAG: hypothetical protein FWC41_14015 [Firmicutes bacterium]|nr:hypothetical protein [Bacillota bacterium]